MQLQRQVLSVTDEPIFDILLAGLAFAQLPGSGDWNGLP